MSVEELDLRSTVQQPAEEDEDSNPLSISQATVLGQQMRSQSFQSTSSTASSTSSLASSMTTVIHHQHQQQLHQQTQMQLAAMQQQQRPQILLKGSSSGSSSKPKFHSFLHQPEMAMTSTGQFLSSSTCTSSASTTTGGSSSSQQQQKFVRQFVRSSSAHNDSVDKPTIKCIRSASQQMEDDPNLLSVENQLQQHQQQVQKMSVLISKSAETIEGATSASSSSSMTTTQLMGTGIRNTLTLSGGLLAPPNRKLTILSPIHAPPGLHDMLKQRHGRSPCSPRIMFPGPGGPFGGLGGPEVDLFG